MIKLILIALICGNVIPAARAQDAEFQQKMVGIAYKGVNNRLPSEVNAEENEKAVQARLACYALHLDYASRIKVCNNAYYREIVAAARKSIETRPSIGFFISSLQLCPVLYNLCLGKTDGNKERCIIFERQCIDYSLDLYWRGSPKYEQQQYRIE